MTRTLPFAVPAPGYEFAVNQATGTYHLRVVGMEHPLCRVRAPLRRDASRAQPVVLVCGYCLNSRAAPVDVQRVEAPVPPWEAADA